MRAPSGHMSRRALLASGLTVAAGAWALGPAALGRRNPLSRLAADAGAPSSVGFVPGATTLAEAIGRRALPAAGLLPGWPLTSGLVRLTVEGLASEGVAAADEQLRQIQLDALLLPPGARRGDPLVFHAWTLHRDRTVTASGRVVFLWSVDRDPTIGFSLEVAHAGDPTRSRQVAVLGDGDEPGSVGLREGVYLFGLTPGAWATPTEVPAREDDAWQHLQSLVVTVQ